LFSIGRTLPTCSTCTGEDMFTLHYRSPCELLLDHCSNLVHKPVSLLLALSDCSCVTLSPPRRLFTLFTSRTSLPITPPHHQALRQPPMCHQTIQPLPSQQTVTTRVSSAGELATSCDYHRSPIAYCQVSDNGNHNNSLTLPLGQRKAAKSWPPTDCGDLRLGDLSFNHYHTAILPYCQYQRFQNCHNLPLLA
jgi:hypothetical protein